MKNEHLPLAGRLTAYFLLVMVSLLLGGTTGSLLFSRLIIAAGMLIPVAIEAALTRERPVRPHPLRGGGLAAATFPLWLFLLSAVSLATSLLMRLLHIPVTSPEISFTFSSFLYVVVLTPITEELFCRYVIFGLCRRMSRSGGGVILASALFFSLMHANAVQIPYAFVGGLFLGAAATVSGSVLLPILLHMGINLFSLCAVRFPNLSAVPFFVLPAALLLGALVFTKYGQGVCAPLRAAAADKEGRRGLFLSLLRSPAPVCLIAAVLIALLRML